MYVYIYIYITLNNTIYSYIVNVDLILICIELSEMRSEVIYYIFLSHTLLPSHSSLTYKRYMKDAPSLKILISAINLQA